MNPIHVHKQSEQGRTERFHTNGGFTLSEMLIATLITLIASTLIVQTFNTALYQTRTRNWESEAQIWGNTISADVRNKLLKTQRIKLASVSPSEKIPDEREIESLTLYDKPGDIITRPVSPGEIYSGDTQRDYGQYGQAEAEIEITYVENQFDDGNEEDPGFITEKLLKVTVKITDPDPIGIDDNEVRNVFYVRPRQADFIVEQS